MFCFVLMTMMTRGREGRINTKWMAITILFFYCSPLKYLQMFAAAQCRSVCKNVSCCIGFNRPNPPAFQFDSFSLLLSLIPHSPFSLPNSELVVSLWTFRHLLSWFDRHCCIWSKCCPLVVFVILTCEIK